MTRLVSLRDVVVVVVVVRLRIDRGGGGVRASSCWASPFCSLWLGKHTGHGVYIDPLVIVSRPDGFFHHLGAEKMTSE